jgi:starvation-inducible DNA-binding protein
MIVARPHWLAIHNHLPTPTGLDQVDASDLASQLTPLLADVFALHIKTRNFHWHISGRHFRDYHLLFGAQAAEIIEIAEPLADRIRVLGNSTIRSIGQVASETRIDDDDRSFVSGRVMVEALVQDNLDVLGTMRLAHASCEDVGDWASARLFERWIDEAERRIWFLFENSRFLEKLEQ